MPRTVRDKNYSEQHARQRYAERYGTELTSAQYKRLCTLVKKKLQQQESVIGHELTQKNPLIEQWVFRFQYDNIEIIPVYETDRDCITTFLPVVPRS